MIARLSFAGQWGSAVVDYQSLFNVAVTLVIFLAGWMLKGLTDAIRRLDDDVRAMPDKYVNKTDYRIELHDIKQLLIRIEEKLDNKADKP